MARTDALNTATADLIRRAGELNLHVVTTVQGASEDPADSSMPREWRELIDAAGSGRDMHDRLVLPETGGRKATLQSRGGDKLVKIWDASDQDALGRHLDRAGVRATVRGR